MSKVSDIHNVQAKAAAVNAKIKVSRAGVKIIHDIGENPV